KTLLKINSNKIIMLQNLRFHPEEEANDLDFAKSLSEYADVYVNDAFGTAHRKHASTHGIISFFKNNSLAGFLIRDELKALTKIIKTPKKPFVGIVGGAKVSDKIKIIEKLLPQVDQLIIGGAMAYPFLKAKGKQIGKSLCSEEDTKLAANILNLPTSQKIVLPIDHIASASLSGDSITVNTPDIPDELIGLDIGNLTIERFKSTLKKAETIFWNGPMGMFENPKFNNGTLSIAKIISQLENAYTLVGGGDSVNAVKQSDLSESFSHISTGGGASLEFIEEGALVGIKALTYGVH
ncbi:MAG: phosphoglycerate kinase, partial [Bdellovibrionales bacterium]|nr:phosphoglycerate kinase [Bdellovibrionales bacterium]